MTFTYDGTPSSDLEKVRLEIGDTDSDTALFSDEELQVFLDRHPSNVLLSAAAACDSLARRFSRAYDFSTDGQSFSRSQMAKAYAQQAIDLRSRSTGVTAEPTTKVDGYSDDIDYAETTATSNRGRVRAGYFDPDLPY